MKLTIPPKPARLVAALGIASMTLLAAGAPQAVAKKAPEQGKKVAQTPQLRAVDTKLEAPGNAYATQWNQFRAHVASKRAADKAPMFGQDDLFARFSAITGAPRVVYGDMGEAPSAGKREDRALLFLQANAHVFGINTADLSFLRKFERAEKPAHFYYEQKFNGLPVFESEVGVHLGADGHVYGVTSSYVPVQVARTSATISAEAAFQAALAATSVDASAVVPEFESERTLGIYPTADGGRLAYRVTVPSRRPAGLFKVYVDANTGEMLDAPQNLMSMIDGQGKVFVPSPTVSEANDAIRDMNDSPTSVPASAYISVVLPGLDASGKLIGPYSQVHPSMSGPVVRADSNFTDLVRDNVQFNEAEVYWAIDKAETTYQSLGYSAAAGAPVMNYAIKVYAHNSPTWGNVDNSSFSGSNIDGTGTGILEFGTGGVDDAEDAEIIWHEYGHATLWNQRPGINQNVSREGIGEGFGDYLAGTMSKRVPGGSSYYVTVGEWDATSYNASGSPHPFLRKLDNPIFWENRGNEVHDAGEIWSHPLFDYDNQVGPDVALDTVLQAHFLFDLSPTQVEGAAAMITADQMLNGGATAAFINNAFRERHTVAGAVVPVVHTIGFAAGGAFFLRNSNTTGAANIVANFGSPSLTPIAGDWDGNGSDTLGAYDSTNGTFFLKNSNAPGGADIVFTFGGGGAGIIPIVGDWDGNGSETIGLYNTANGTIFLRNSNSNGGADVVFSFGGGGTLLPIVGDWDGNGTDTIGVYNTATSTFFLRNTNSNGGADVTFGFGGANPTYLPVAGDWDGDNIHTVGLYDSANGTYFFRNSNTPGPASYIITFGAGGGTPLAGDWNGGMH
jgi:hypothetical protein